MFLLSRSGTTDVSTNTAIDDTREVGGIAIDAGRATGLVDTSVLGLVIVELDGISLGATGGRRGGLDGGDDGFGGNLLAVGDVRDGEVTELREGDLAGTLGLDLVEEEIAISRSPRLVDDLAFLAHLGEVRVIHFGLGTSTEGGESFESTLEIGHYRYF